MSFDSFTRIPKIINNESTPTENPPQILPNKLPKRMAPMPRPKPREKTMTINQYPTPVVAIPKKSRHSNETKPSRFPARHFQLNDFISVKISAFESPLKDLLIDTCISPSSLYRLVVRLSSNSVSQKCLGNSHYQDTGFG